MSAEEEQDKLNKNIDLVLSHVKTEMLRALDVHGPMKSRHDGASIIHEEYDEFWTEVKRNSHENQMSEGIQLAAMASLYVATFLKK